MQEAEIIAAIRRGIREPSPVTIDDDGISKVILRGVTLIGHMIHDVDPSYFNTHKSISSYTYAFTKPTDCLTILKIWDLGDNAITITGATNASPIVITATSHGFSDDAIVFIHDVGGNTAANGTFKITYINANSFSLDGSAGNGTYTSGGKVFEEPSSPDEIIKINLSEANLSNINKWYPRANEIVVDDSNFTNDIIIDYVALPTALSDIHSGLHEWLISFGITDLMVIDPDDPHINDKIKTVRFHEKKFGKIEHLIRINMKASREPSYVRNIMQI